MPNVKLCAAVGQRGGVPAEKANKTVPPHLPATPPGKQLVQSSGCLNCHTLEGEKSAHKAPALAAIDGGRWTLGCMAPNADARGKAPDFGLTDAQRNALLAFAATDRSSLARETPAEFSARQVAAMRCSACTRATEGCVISTDYAATPRRWRRRSRCRSAAGSTMGAFAPTSGPPAHLAGEKLRPEWSAAPSAAKCREVQAPPYLHARMPAGRPAKLLAHGSRPSTGTPTSEPYPLPDEQMRRSGRS